MPPHKEPRNVIDAEHRMAMVKLLLNGDPGLELCDFEITKKSVSYSIDTVRYFKNEYPSTKIHFLIGSDAFYNIDTWKQSQELMSLIDFIIFPRAGNTKEMIARKFGNLSNVVYWAHTSLIHISSTDIRYRSAQWGRLRGGTRRGRGGVYKGKQTLYMKNRNVIICAAVFFH